MRRFFLFVLVLLTGRVIAQEATFSQKELQQDLDSLASALRELHPGLYRYQSPEQFDSTVQATRMALRENMPLRDAYAVFSQLVSGIRCGHTVIVPRTNWADTLSKASFYFPFQVFFVQGVPYLTFNRSANQEIRPGDKLLTINGRPVEDIRREIFRHLFSDGYNESLKYRQTHDYLFFYYYNCFIEQADSFHIQYENARKEIKTATVPALGMQEMARNVSANPVNRAFLKAIQHERPYTHELLLDKQKDVAIIFLRQFYGGRDGETARKALTHFMDDCIWKIKRRGISDVIIDMRYNPGGYDNQGQVLLSYFINEPVLYYNSMHTIMNSSPLLEHSSLSKEDLVMMRDNLVKQPDGTYRIPLSLNKTLDSVWPAANHFSGHVYFLVNGGTGSTAAEFTAVAQYLRVGQFIGEETAGNYTGGNGAEFVGLLLPHTRMHATIPLVYYENAVGTPQQKGRGTLPDYPDNYTIDEALSGRDTARELAYRLIEDQRAKAKE
ncbi:hypothetical protein HHL17_19420 [Chitinophaga sp. G-6-1-13]|uniref:Tail specific protease domain-containing protein n=1 Tax=Chitinophaga fulva TaxID=2728842 RepID=A0A848GPU7_9BACT|nr:S41 family peptidase [Chitinophaga fulva]NML39379.1 hypothetical protein [Chitinophaga fulva]